MPLQIWSRYRRSQHVRLIILTILTVFGCSRTTMPPARDIQAKIPAIKSAAESKDMNAAPRMVKDLESDDPAVRFYAIEGLERLTGQTFGYVYYDDSAHRHEAVMKWRQWLDEHTK